MLRFVTCWFVVGGCVSDLGIKAAVDTGAVVATEPTSDPPTSDPTTSDPTTSDPPTSDPTTSDPTTSDPTTSDPTTSDPPTSDPTTSAPGPLLPGTVVVPAGCAAQGCTPGQEGECWYWESPSVPICLTRSFWMSETEVTQRQFESVMRYNPSEFVGELRPVEWVTWDEAAAYTNALSDLEGLPRCYSCTGAGPSVRCVNLELGSIYDCLGYRLPTEAEWEHAARCGTDLKYAGSDEVDLVGWYNGNADAQTKEVALKLPNGCGLYDLSGNVAEWTNDWHDFGYYAVRPTTDPEGPPSGTFRVDRGGAWAFEAPFLRVSARDRDNRRTSFDGIRVARTAP